MGRRDSSPRSTSSDVPRRPRLRACVTEPSITTSNASRGALASPHSAQRATDLLSRNLVYGGPGEYSPRDISSSASRDTADAVLSPRAVAVPTSRSRHSGDSLDDGSASLDSGCYFSFPNFDDFEGEHGRKEDDVNGEYA